MEKIKLVFGTYSSSLSYAASEVAERNKVIYWEQGAIADNITARGFKYLFRTIPRAGDFGNLAVNFANEVVAPKLKMDPKKMKVGIMFEDSLYGTTVGNSAAKKAKELGMDVVATESYSHKTVDLSSVVMIFKVQESGRDHRHQLHGRRHFVLEAGQRNGPQCESLHRHRSRPRHARMGQDLWE